LSFEGQAFEVLSSLVFRPGRRLLSVGPWRSSELGNFEGVPVFQVDDGDLPLAIAHKVDDGYRLILCRSDGSMEVIVTQRDLTGMR
jgi:hypothetical protein